MARDTRNRLLDVGLELFAEQGLAATTVTELEARTGLRSGSGSFYRHFRSKQDLFAAVVERELVRVDQAFQDGSRSVGAGPDVQAALTVELNRVLVSLHRLDVLTRITSRNRDALGVLTPQVERTISRGVDVNADLLAELMDAGTIPRRDPRALAVVIANALLGYHLTTTYLDAPPGAVEPEAIIAVLVELVAPAPRTG